MALHTPVQLGGRSSPRVPTLRGHRRGRWGLLLVMVLVAVGVIVVNSRPTPGAAPFTPEIIPPSVGDAIPGQRIVLLVTFAGDGRVTDPATVTASTTPELAPAVELSVVPAQIRPGGVAEVTVVIDDTVVADLPDDGEPILGQREPPRPADRTAGPQQAVTPISPTGPEGASVPVTVTLTRGGTEIRRDVPINISRGEDHLLDDAASHRDRFVAWLESERPEVGITSSTEWVGTPVQPHILVVSHYLFFSDDWEMSVMWHIMIAPHDWSRISLRPRDQLSPTLAYEIPSVSAPTVVEIEPPAYVDR
jgi:hypothetical protein